MIYMNSGTTWPSSLHASQIILLYSVENTSEVISESWISLGIGHDTQGMHGAILP